MKQFDPFLPEEKTKEKLERNTTFFIIYIPTYVRM